MGIFGLFGIWLVINWAVSLGLAVLLWEKLHATQGVLRKASTNGGFASMVYYPFACLVTVICIYATR